MVEARPLFDDDDQPIPAKSSPSGVAALQFAEEPAQGRSGCGQSPRPTLAALELPEEPEPRQRPAISKTAVALDLPDEPARVKRAPDVAALSLPDAEPIAAGRSGLFTRASSLDLPDVAPAPKAAGYVSKPSDVFVMDEHPSIAAAMKRGEEQFPDIMKKSGFLVRNNLNALVPVTFDTLSSHGSATLTRAAGLVDKIAAATKAVHEVGAAEQIQGIVDHADRTKQKKSLLGLIGSMKPFDPAAANAHLTAIKEALRIKLRVVDELRQDMERIKDSLTVEVTTMAILSGMTDHADIGGLVVRRANLFNVSFQEVNMALTQVANIETSVREWVMRCDEVKTVTLPALGFRASL
jgi:hypothetical protein